MPNHSGVILEIAVKIRSAVGVVMNPSDSIWPFAVVKSAQKPISFFRVATDPVVMRVNAMISGPKKNIITYMYIALISRLPSIK